jgi:antitoxin ParD1/3/4
MPTRNVVITDKQAEMIDRLVSSGRYQNASEVLREGLRLIESRDADEKARLKAFREAVCVGVADSDAGRVRRFESTGELRSYLTTASNTAIAEGLARRRRR